MMDALLIDINTENHDYDAQDMGAAKRTHSEVHLKPKL